MTDRSAAAAWTGAWASTSAGRRSSPAICRIGRDVPLAKHRCQAVQSPTMTDKIRVGIVGATVTQGGSGWGANAHVPAIKLLPEYELKAVCTSHEETAQASKEKFGAELAFHNINDMAAHPDIDLIVVSVRVPWHKDLVMAGLRAGKPVFCEWPLGANLAEAEE